MRLVIANHSLDHAGGIESYTTTVADHLQRLGHDVLIFSREDGFTGDVARALGLRVVTDPARLPVEIDVVFSQDGAAALEMLELRPAAPQIYVWHSDLFDLHIPPQIEGAVARIVTLWGGARAKAEALAVGAPIVEMSHPVDTDRFKPRTPLRRPPRALALGNYLTGERMRILQQACELAGIELVTRGLHTDRGATDRPEDEMNAVDIVFAKAKAAIEAMACGRAVFIFDAFGSDGWVTSDNFDELEQRCLSGTGASQTVTPDALVEALARYSPAMGVVNRDLAVSRHGAIAHTSALVALAREVAAEVESDSRQQSTRREHDASFELARLTRVNWRHESRAFFADARLQQSELRRGDAEWKLEQSEADRAAAMARAEAAETRLAEVLASRRWRTLNALLMPFDRLRGRGGA